MTTKTVKGRTPQGAILLELTSVITLSPADNPQAETYENRKAKLLAHDAARVLPLIDYWEFSEVVGHLDQNGETFEAFVSRQISNLYFLLRLRAAAVVTKAKGADKKLAVLNGDDDSLPEIPFPDGILEKTPQATVLQLLANYLTEEWNRYASAGPTRNRHEAIARSRLHYLIQEVVTAYGGWVWPFFYHFESSDHVDHMLKLVEDSNGRIPLSTG